MQNNQIWIKSPIGLKDNSTVMTVLILVLFLNATMATPTSEEPTDWIDQISLARKIHEGTIHVLKIETWGQ